MGAEQGDPIFPEHRWNNILLTFDRDLTIVVHVMI
jgi:hypothetical protein